MNERIDVAQIERDARRKAYADQTYPTSVDFSVNGRPCKVTITQGRGRMPGMTLMAVYYMDGKRTSFAKVAALARVGDQP